MFNFLNRFKWFRKRSSTPYFSLVNSSIDEYNMVELELEWNQAFIDKLRAAGYKGDTDDELVTQYLNVISNIAKKES